MSPHEQVSVSVMAGRQGARLLVRQLHWSGRKRVSELLYHEMVDLPGDLHGMTPEILKQIMEDALVEWCMRNDDPGQEPLF